MPFQPDYRHMLAVLQNKRPARLPLYEHKISPAVIMEQILDLRFAELEQGDEADLKQFFAHYCRFYQEMTYDTVSFEVTITRSLPDHGAIYGSRPGPIQTRADFVRYPWSEIPRRYWENAGRKFELLSQALPAGAKAVGGPGNGVFELSEDLVGFQYLAYMMVDDPELFADLYRRIGDLMVEIWTVFLERYADQFVICRFGDDLGFKTSTLVAPKTIREHIMPQYRRVIQLIHQAGRPFLWHSCGKIFSIMDEMIELGINAKHSNEDTIAPFQEWIARYGDRIGLLGGIDVDILCQRTPDQIVDYVVEKGQQFRDQANGYALGSGNSIPDYVPVEGYLAMIEAARQIRRNEMERSA
jgi:uroporphyrinogen decarboxylase